MRKLVARVLIPSICFCAIFLIWYRIQIVMLQRRSVAIDTQRIRRGYPPLRAVPIPALVPSQLMRAIESFDNRRRLVVFADIHFSCESKRDPEMFDGDFNNDGRKDYCVLLLRKSHEHVGAGRHAPSESGLRNGQRSGVIVELRVVAFMGAANGRFEPHVIKPLAGELDDVQYPVSVTINRSEPQVVSELYPPRHSTPKKISVTTQGIYLDYCERASVLYYWDHGEFRGILVSN